MIGLTGIAKRPAFVWLGLGASCALLLLAGNGLTTVFDRDEARFALAVKEMTERGDLVVPTNWGEPRYHKPILVYWLAMASERLLGRGEFALRFPSAVFGVLTCLVTAAAARRWYGERVAWRAGWILATALVFVIESKVLTADAALLFSTTLSFWAWGRLRQGVRHRGRWQLLFWLGAGLGVLAKVVNVVFLAFAGCALAYLRSSWSRAQHAALWAALAAAAIAASVPGLGFVGPATLAVVALLALARSIGSPGGRSAWAALGWRWGLPLAAAIAAVWVAPALIRTRGAFLTEGIGHHLLGRTVRPFEGHAGLPGYYLATTVVALFPWGALLPSALYHAVSRVRHDDTLAFLAAWIAGPWVVLELVSTKLPHYVLATVPALAVLVALEWERRLAGAALPGRRARLGEAALLVVPCLAALGGAAAVAWRFDGTALKAAWLGLGTVALACGAWGARALARAAYAGLCPFLAAGAAALYLVLALAALPALETARIARPLGEAVGRHLRPGMRLVVHKFTDASVGYYLPRQAEVVDDRRQVARLLAADGPDALVVVPNGGREPRFDELLREFPVAYEHLETVRGIVFPDMREHEVWLVRGRPAGR